MKKIIPLLFVSTALLLFGSIFPSLTQGQVSGNDTKTGYQLTVPIPGQGSSVSGPSDYIHKIYNFGLYAGGILAVLMVVIGGIQWTLSEVITKKQDAMDMIRSALLGLALLLAAFVILKLINPIFDINNIDNLQPTLAPLPPPSDVPPPPAGPASAPQSRPQLSVEDHNGEWIIHISYAHPEDQIEYYSLHNGAGLEIARIPGSATSYTVPHDDRSRIFWALAINALGQSNPSDPVSF